VLRAEGLIESRQGIGTFVRQENRLIRISRGRYGRARADQQLLSSRFRHEITSAGPEEAPAEVAEAFDIKPGERVVVRRRRLTDNDGRLVELGASYLPPDVAAGTFLENRDVVPKALFLCIEDLSGRRYTQAHDRWIARMPNAVEAVEFDLPTGAPVMHLLHVAHDEDGKVLEVSESTWPANDMAMIDDYKIEQEALVPSVVSDI
jgi:DNA-binding GntR family transcriptional regulator